MDTRDMTESRRLPAVALARRRAPRDVLDGLAWASWGRDEMGEESLGSDPPSLPFVFLGVPLVLFASAIFVCFWVMLIAYSNAMRKKHEL